jgi:beta-propeller repeat-containing protein
MNFLAKKILLAGVAVSLSVLAVAAQTALSLGNLPLYFEASSGPAAGPAQFIARGRDAQFQISPTAAQFVLQKSGVTRAVQMQFLGANPQAQICGDNGLAGKINYFTGSDPAQWRSGIPTFAKVRVAEIYPGVSVIYYGNERQLEYDFTVSPDKNPETIAIRFDGADKISVSPQGELVLNLGNDEIRQPKPLIYQTIGDARKEIVGGYKVLDAHTVAFAVGKYDHALPLVIDPVLSYSTYFGGTLGETAWAVAVDTNDNSIYIAGQTFSKLHLTNGVVVSPFSTNGSFSTTNAYQTNFAGGTLTGDAFVAKFDNSGTNLIYLTYLGGGADDGILSIALDGDGDAYVTGFTDSTNFPVTNSIPGGVPGIPNSTNISGTFGKGFGSYPIDAFVAELNPGGSSLIYSTYLGGSAADAGYGIAVDAQRNAYVTGFTASTNFPTANALAFHLIGQTNTALTTLNYLACTNSVYFNQNAFVAEIAAGGTNLLFSTYFGGNNFDEGRSIAVDSLNNVYVTGWTASTNFPTTNFISQTFITQISTNRFTTNSYSGNLLNSSTNKFNSAYDAFVAKLSPSVSGGLVSTSLVYSTYLGGTNNDFAYGIAVDNNGAAYVTGSTVSTNFPNTLTNIIGSGLTNNIGTSSPATTNAFLTKITNGTSAAIAYSVTFGGRWSDTGYGIAIDPATNVFIVGTTGSTNFPCFPTNGTGSLRVTNSGGNDVFVTAFNAANPTNCSLLYSTYLGGKGNDYGYGIAVDALGNAYVVGQTLSTNFPTFHAYQAMRNGTNDTFLAKILLTTATPPALTALSSGTNVIVSWPPIVTEENVFKLQSNTNLLSTNWVVVPQSPVLTNGSNIVTFNPTNPAQFFRLRSF